MSGHLSTLAGLFPGPILVVGGGMSVPSDLAKLGQREWSLVISANDHAFKIRGLEPDFIVCKDHKHTETGEFMALRLAQHHTPIISRHWWAHHRISDWPMTGNSGLMAIAVAAVLGGNPIVPIGFDFYQDGTYWHDPNAKNVSRGTGHLDMRAKMAKLQSYLGAAEIRAVSGPFSKGFKPSGGTGCRIMELFQRMEAVKVRAIREFAFSFDRRVLVPTGAEIMVSKTELLVPETFASVEIAN